MCITKTYKVNFDNQNDIIEEVNGTSNDEKHYAIEVIHQDTPYIGTDKITINGGQKEIYIGNWKFLCHSITCINTKEKKLRIDIKCVNLEDKEEYDFYYIGNYIEDQTKLPDCTIELITEIAKHNSIQEFDAAEPNSSHVGRIKVCLI